MPSYRDSQNGNIFPPEFPRTQRQDSANAKLGHMSRELHTTEGNAQQSAAVDRGVRPQDAM